MSHTSNYKLLQELRASLDQERGVDSMVGGGRRRGAGCYGGAFNSYPAPFGYGGGRGGAFIGGSSWTNFLRAEAIKHPNLSGPELARDPAIRQSYYNQLTPDEQACYRLRQAQPKRPKALRTPAQRARSAYNRAIKKYGPSIYPAPPGYPLLPQVNPGPYAPPYATTQFIPHYV